MDPPRTLHQNLAILRSLYHGDSSSPGFRFAENLIRSAVPDDGSLIVRATPTDAEAAALLPRLPLAETPAAVLGLLRSGTWEDQAAGHLIAAVRRVARRDFCVFDVRVW